MPKRTAISTILVLALAVMASGCGPGNLTPSTTAERAAIEAAVRGCGLKVEDPSWSWIREFKQWEFKFRTDAAGMAKADCVEDVKKQLIATRNLDVAVGYLEADAKP